MPGYVPGEGMLHLRFDWRIRVAVKLGPTEEETLAS